MLCRMGAQAFYNEIQTWKNTQFWSTLTNDLKALLESRGIEVQVDFDNVDLPIASTSDSVSKLIHIFWDAFIQARFL